MVESASTLQPSALCINNNVSVLERSKNKGGTVIVPNNAHPRPVFVTPLAPSVSQLRQRMFKVLLKVVSKSEKGHKVFILRNLDQGVVTSGAELKRIIRAQLKDVVTGDFDGRNMVST